MDKGKILCYGVIFVLLFVGFVLLCNRIRWLEWMERLLRQTRESVEQASRQRLLENRRDLLALRQKHTLWYGLEQELHYSGWKRRMPFLTAELWIVGNVMVASGLFLCFLVLWKHWGIACVIVLASLSVEGIGLWVCKVKEMQAVNNNLLKFLNFLGNYSITAGEITGIFKQISRYVEEPLKSVLVDCCYEAQTTGDVGGAFLAMAEKIEHPKFKELARNMEVTLRYCADLSLLVMSSRKSIREYLRLGEERRGMLSEALVSVALLLIMSLFSLMTVDKLITVSIWDILRNTMTGRLAIGIVAGTMLLLVRQFYRIYK